MSLLRSIKKPYFALFLLLVAVVPLAFASKSLLSAKADATTQHYLYVFPDNSMNVYDMDNGFKLVKSVSLATPGGRGVAVDTATGMLYFSYHGDGGPHGNGSLLKYNLLTDTVVWTKDYPFGIDSMALSKDGKKIYMPDGEAAYDGTWHIFNASDGSVAGSIFINTGGGAHNTVVSLNGTHAYLGELNYTYLVQVDTATNQISKQIGPLKPGVRPFTINGAETLAYTTASGFLGFEVSSITSGQRLYTVPVQGFSAAPNAPVPSHGISLSPDEKEVYVIDTSNSYAHVFDVSGVPASAPKQVADIPLRTMTGTETPCLYDCTHEGWILHSGDGRYVFVGDSGDVIDTKLRKSVANIDTLFNTRKYLEIDWANGKPVFNTTRHGLGYVTGSGLSTPTATPISSTPTPVTSPTTTPTPGTTLATDTFQRANQSHWGKASDGSTWGGDANTQGAFSISNNAGQVSGGGTSFNALLGASTANSDVLFNGSMSSYNNSNIGSLLRWTDNNNWYKAYLSGNNLILQKKVAGTTTTITSVPFTASAGVNYSLRFRAVGTTLYVKAWQTGTAEPANWMITTTDSSLQSGYCGLRMLAQSGVIATYTSFTATSM